MKIGFASNDWAMKSHEPLTGHPTWGGAGWARCGLPARFLRAAGHDVVEGTLVFRKSVGRFYVRDWEGGHHDVDLLVMQRWMFASISVELPQAISSGQVVVNDVDDHFWALDPRNQAYEASDPKRSVIENRQHYLAVLKASSAVTVSTPYLADELRRLGVRVPLFVLENRVDTEAFETSRLMQSGRQSGVREFHGKKPVVGWVGATPWRSGDLETLRGVLGPFLEAHDLRAYHGGHLDRAASFADQTEVPADRVRTLPMVPIHEYPMLFIGLDVGLVPLRDARFNRAKSWIKGIEYAAAGVPFVASALPEYERLARTVGVGRVASRPKQWRAHLSDLLDPHVRAEEAAKNFEAVKALDIRAGIGEWADLYADLLNRSRA